MTEDEWTEEMLSEIVSATGLPFDTNGGKMGWQICVDVFSWKFANHFARYLELTARSRCSSMELNMVSVLKQLLAK